MTTLTCHSARAALSICLIALVGGCDRNQKDSSPGSAPAASPTVAPQGPSEAGKLDASHLHCGEVLSRDDFKALGLEASGFEPEQTPRRKGEGVTCVKEPVTVTLFPGDAFSTMIDGFKANAEKMGATAEDGPAVGGQSQWTVMSGFHSVMFQSGNRRYAANLSGSDKAQVAKLAQRLAANMQKH